MTLEKQLISAPFGQGINTKIDPKQLQPGPLTNLQNGIFLEQGLIQKRNGLELLGREIDVTEDLILRGEALSVYNDQLLLFTGAKAYSRLSFNERWSDQGNVSSVINSTFQVVRNDYTQSNPDVAKVDGLECYVWEDQRGGVRYSIVDAETGNFVINDQLVSLEASKPKVLSLLENDSYVAQFVIFFVSGTTIKYTRLSTNALNVPLVVFTLTSDLHDNQVYDACQAVGEVSDEIASSIFVTYASRYDATYVYTNPRTFKIDSSAAYLWSYDFILNSDDLVATHIAVAPLADASFSLAILANTTAGIIWDDGYDLKVAKIPYYIGPLTSQTITVPIDFDISQLTNYAFCWNGHQYNDQIALDVFFEFTRDGYYSIKAGVLDVFIHGEVFAVGELDNLYMRKHDKLYSKPFNYNGSTYIMISHVTDLQPTYFLLNRSLEVVSKASQNLAGPHRTSLLAEFIYDDYTLTNTLEGDGYVLNLPTGNGIFKIPTLKKGKLQSESGNIFNKLGVTSTSLDFVSESHFLSTQLNNSLHVVGGVLQSYDGNIFTENGFHLYPENLVVNQQVFAVTVTVSGTGVLSQVTDGYFVPASRINSGDYWTINSGLDERSYYVWYRVDGVGSDPQVAGKTGIQVNINSYYTATEVATITKNVLNLYYIDFAATSSGSQVTITNSIPGATSNPTAGTMTAGSIGAGSYQYIAIWKWVDNQGYIHRSTTSVPESVTVVGSNKTVTIGVPLLSLTNKPNVILELYRNENNGSVFYKVTSTNNPIFNIVNNDGYYTHVFVTDDISDADLISNEIIYTTGGVLDNSSPPPCSIITTYKNRIFIAGLDNKHLIQYGKITPPDQKDTAAGFSDLFTIELDARGGKIIMLSQMDDKLIIFKESQIYYISGDGPNNTGEGSTFSEPQLITTDVGCSNSNSVVTTPNGLMFKSSKGLYLLGRDLQVKYVGSPVEQFNSLTIASSILLNGSNQVRFVTEDGVALIYNYYFDQWSTFTNYESVDCDLFQNKFVLLRSDGSVLRESETSFADGYAGGLQHVPLLLETANFSLAGLNGLQRVYRAFILGEYKGNHNTVVSFAYDYSPVYTDTATFDGYSVIGQYTYGATGPYGTTNGNVYGGNYIPYQFRVHLKQQKCTALRIKIEDTQSSPFNEGFNISGLTLQVGIKPSGIKLPANKSLGSD